MTPPHAETPAPLQPAADTLLQRAWLAYRTVGRTFGAWASPLATAALFAGLRSTVAAGRALDPLLFPRLRQEQPRAPLVIVGNPRSGTTFLHRFLVKGGVGAGQELWQMLYPSLALQRLVRPALPLLEAVSPARHHSTAAHKTGLTSVETDDVSLLFRYFDGFFLYGFILAFAERDLRALFEPDARDTAGRDFDWLHDLWRRRQVSSGRDRVVAKLFSLSVRLPAFQGRFPDARVLYLARDPVETIPSGMSLVTGVLDKRFGFWSLPAEVRDRYLERLYRALVELMERFRADWAEGRIDRSGVLVVPYPRLMQDFEGMMDEILAFAGHAPDAALRAAIAAQAEKQRSYQSGHRYSLSQFNLDADRIRRDCAAFREAFLPGEATTSA